MKLQKAVKLQRDENSIGIVIGMSLVSLLLVAVVK